MYRKELIPREALLGGIPSGTIDLQLICFLRDNDAHHLLCIRITWGSFKMHVLHLRISMIGLTPGYFFPKAPWSLCRGQPQVWRGHRVRCYSGVAVPVDELE